MIQSIPNAAGAATGGAVGGASNLTTVGAVPYVSSSGVLNQDATALFWDATNDRLGLGTNAPATAIHILKSDAAQTELRIENANTGGFANRLGFYRDATVNAYIDYVRNTGTLNIVNAYTAGAIQLATGGATRAVVQGTTGNITVGTTTTDDNYKLSVTSSGSTGTLRVFDQGGAGVSQTVFRNGAAQSGASPVSFQVSSGAQRGYIETDDSIFNAVFYGFRDLNDIFKLSASGATPILAMASSGILQWSSTGVYTGGKDLGLARAAAGVLEVNNGTAGTFRDLRARVVITSQSTPAASTDAGTAGAIWADATYLYVQTAAGTIKRVTLNAF